MGCDAQHGWNRFEAYHANGRQRCFVRYVLLFAHAHERQMWFQLSCRWHQLGWCCSDRASQSWKPVSQDLQPLARHWPVLQVSHLPWLHFKLLWNTAFDAGHHFPLAQRFWEPCLLNLHCRKLSSAIWQNLCRISAGASTSCFATMILL